MDQDEDGMRVIADIHGMGDPEDEAAKDEFRLIKEGVLADVRDASLIAEFS